MSGGRDALAPNSRWGLLIAVVIVLGWLTSLVGLLGVNLHHLPSWALVASLLVRTQLQTGLFIVGHDAMHGHLWPGQRARNDAIGRLALALYAVLPYHHCRSKHQRHHHAPATASDPDFPADPSAGFLRWYGAFLVGYLSSAQMAGLLCFWLGLAMLFSHINPSAWLNVLCFCTVPLLLSSWQLFLIGTYLPHRVQRPPCCHDEPASLDLPPWLSLLACFHFGYHREHHDHPGLAWFQLPQVRHRSQSLTLSGPPR